MPREAAEESDAGQVFVRSLIRSQLRLGLVVAGGFLLILLAFPLMLGLVPGLADRRLPACLSTGSSWARESIP